jgi:hypothetical protein
MANSSSSSSAADASIASSSSKARGTPKPKASYLLPEDSEEGGSFEKAHPLVVPKALSQVRTLERAA